MHFGRVGFLMRECTQYMLPLSGERSEQSSGYQMFAVPFLFPCCSVLIVNLFGNRDDIDFICLLSNLDTMDSSGNKKWGDSFAESLMQGVRWKSVVSHYTAQSRGVML